MANHSEFTDENIQKLFGHEAAEDESFERLKQYYLKTSIYNRVTSDVPLRILVGHKGIGKSALIQIAISEDKQNGILPLLIRPDDILEVAASDNSFLQLIREWKDGLYRIIAQKALHSFGLNNDGISSQVMNTTGKLVSYILDTVKGIKSISVEPSKRIIIDNFIKNNSICVYFDDLDRGWEGKPTDISKISALINALRDISNNNRNIRFRLALRSDVYFLVRTSDESTDKIEGSVVWYSWTNNEILIALIKRIETYFGREVNEQDLRGKKQRLIAHYLHSVMEPRFTGEGHWSNAPMHRVLMSLIRKRPRDLVKLCTLAARNALNHNSNRIKTIHLKNIFEEYSQGRIQDTINEYRSELPEIERLIMGMRPSKFERKASLGYIYDTSELLKKLGNITEQGAFYFAGQRLATHKQLAQFLYKINFLTARKTRNDGKVIRKYFEENRYIYGEFVDFGFAWEVHPAYRWALQPSNIHSIFKELELSADDLDTSVK